MTKISIALEAAARAACIADGGAPDAVDYKNKHEWEEYVESSQAAILAWSDAREKENG